MAWTSAQRCGLDTHGAATHIDLTLALRASCTRRHMQVIAGKDKGVIGTITRVVTSNGKVVVEGVNIRTKHIAPRSQEETGQIKKQEYPIHHSNVMLYSKEKGVRSRVSHKVTEEGKKVRMGACMEHGHAWALYVENQLLLACMQLWSLSVCEPGRGMDGCHVAQFAVTMPLVHTGPHPGQDWRGAALNGLYQHSLRRAVGCGGCCSCSLAGCKSHASGSGEAAPAAPCRCTISAATRAAAVSPAVGLLCHQQMHGLYTHSHGRHSHGRQGYGAQEWLAPAAAARHVCCMAFAVAAGQLSMLCLPRSLTSLLAGEFGYTVCGRVGHVSIESLRHF